MTAWWPLLAVLLPLAAAAWCGQGRVRLAVFAGVPLPLCLLGLGGQGHWQAPQLLLGLGLAVDATNQPLLILAGVGWTLAGAYAAHAIAPRQRGFDLFWMLTLAGHALALLGADVVSFYLGYVVMSVAAYGLVVHERSDEAWRAGRIYLVLAFAGEALVLSGLLMLAGVHGNADFSALAQAGGSTTTAALLMGTGFAVKLGIAPLHVWLPLAHPVAPVPASAVLSGLLVKAGLLGMLRFLPDLQALTGVLMAIGLGTAAYGAVVGLTQQRLKTVLAYSTISQMGLALVGVGALVSGPGRAAASAALGLFALHHGLNKIALFLAAGHRLQTPWVRLAFALPALALVGLPLGSGYLAKAALKDAVDVTGAAVWLPGLALSTLLTTLLMLHAWRLAVAQERGRAAPHPAWVLAVIAGLALPWWWAWQGGLLPDWKVAGLGDALWPVVLGLALHLLWHRVGRGRGLVWPEGDVVVWLERAAQRLAATVGRLAAAWSAFEPAMPDLWPPAQRLQRAEIALARLPLVGLCLVGLLLLFWWALRSS